MYLFLPPKEGTIFIKRGYLELPSQPGMEIHLLSSGLTPHLAQLERRAPTKVVEVENADDACGTKANKGASAGLVREALAS